MEAEVEPSSSDVDGTLLDLLIVMEKVKEHSNKEVQRLEHEHEQGSACTFTAATSNEELERSAGNRQSSRSRSSRRGCSKGSRSSASPLFAPRALPKKAFLKGMRKAEPPLKAFPKKAFLKAMRKVNGEKMSVSMESRATSSDSLLDSMEWPSFRCRTSIGS